MKFKLLILALTSGSVFAGQMPAPAPSSVPPPPVSAGKGTAFNYDFVQVDWSQNDTDGLGVSDGAKATVSFSPVDSFLIYGSWGQTWDDSVDFREFEIGVGVYFPVIDNLDFVARVGYGYTDADVLETVTLNQDAFVASVGFRLAITEWLEFAPAYRFALANGDSFSAVTGSLLFDIGTDVQLSINGGLSDQDSEFGAGIRYNF